MSMTIYSPQVQAYAREHGVTDLQAYRALKSRETIERAQKQARGYRRWFAAKECVSPDWNKY